MSTAESHFFYNFDLAENRHISRQKKQKIDRSPSKLGAGNIDSVNGTIDFINARFFGV